MGKSSVVRQFADAASQKKLCSSVVWKQLKKVPNLASKFGRGLCLIEGDRVSYFPVPNRHIPQLPIPIGCALWDYDLKSQVLVVSDRLLTESTLFQIMYLADEPERQKKSGTSYGSRR